VDLFSCAAAAFFLYAASSAVRLISAECAPTDEVPILRGTAEEDPVKQNPVKRAQLLRWALAANPRDTSASIELGLLQESLGETREAEESLLRAARFDHQHLAAWTLANFYFRRQNQAAFWTWAQETARLNFDDLRPLLRLACALEPEPGKVLDRLGDRSGYQLLDVLIELDRMDRAQQLARILMRRPDTKREAVLDLTTRQIAHGRASDANELWSWLHPPADPLAEPPDGEGFRPKLIRNPGLETEWNPGRIVFRFGEIQSDAFPLLERVVAVPVSAARYRLVYEFAGSVEGLNFSLDGVVRPVNGADARFPLEAGRYNQDHLRLVPLRLYYHRTPGAQKLQGELTLRKLHLIQEKP
jgi:hypothetical protein